MEDCSWNCSGLTTRKLEMLEDFDADVIALQETHLAVTPLEVMKRFVQGRRGQLLHGRPPPTESAKRRVAGDPDGGGSMHCARSRGVGVWLAPGVTARELRVPGRAWRVLWNAQRVHAIEFPARLGSLVV